MKIFCLFAAIKRTYSDAGFWPGAEVDGGRFSVCARCKADSCTRILSGGNRARSRSCRPVLKTKKAVIRLDLLNSGCVQRAMSDFEGVPFKLPTLTSEVD